MPLGLAAGIVCLSLGVLSIRAALRSHSTPEQRERRRRSELNTHGRLGDALLADIQENALYYTYEVRGVQYAASQDISSLREQMPEDTERVGGIVSMKYSARNPANSMLICEDWSGLRLRRPSANANNVRHAVKDAALAEHAEG